MIWQTVTIKVGRSAIVNDKQVTFTLSEAVKAEIKAGRMCVPMSYIAAALDIQKSWDSVTETATFTNVMK